MVSSSRALELAEWLESMKPIGVFSSTDGVEAKSEISEALRMYSTIVKRIKAKRDELSITMRQAKKNGWENLKASARMRLDLLDAVENGRIEQDELC